MTDNNTSPVTRALSGGGRIFVIFCALSALAADAVAAVLLIVRGSGFGYLAMPLVLAVIDALFTVAAFNSSFRFKYAIVELVLYIAANILTLNIIAMVCIGSGVFSKDAIKFMLALRSVIIVCTTLSAVYSAVAVKSHRLAQTVIVAVLSAATAITSLTYIINLFTGGYFGQGGLAQRALIFEYDNNTDGYFVTGAVGGREKNITVPYEFDGKLVTGVSCKIFADARAENVTLNCPSAATFIDTYALGNVSPELAIYADKSRVDLFKDKFYKLTESDYGFDIANRITPCALDDGEIYVTFGYDKEAYSIVGGDVLATYYAQKGDVFSLDGYSQNYAVYSDKHNSDHLWQCYCNNGYILNAPEYGGEKLVGKTLAESCDSVAISFDRVYSVLIGADNDELYEAPKSDLTTIVGGMELSYKLTSLEFADEIIDNFTRRDGFTLGWTYEYGSQDIPFTSLSAELTARRNDLIIHPVWTMNEFALTTTPLQFGTVYGDRVTMSASTDVTADELYATYVWKKDGVVVGDGSSFTIERMPFQNAKYELTVTVTGDNTSLIETKSAVFEITVARRTVTAVWSDPSSLKYCGEDMLTFCELTGVLAGDDVTTDVGQFAYRDAGVYDFAVGLTGADSSKYVLAGGSHRVNVAKATLDVTWENTRVVYNGEYREPTVTATGFIGDDMFGITVSGATNAGTYTAVAGIADGYDVNYVLSQSTHTFIIDRYTVEVVWTDGGDGSFVYEYDGAPHVPSASAVGVGGALALRVTGASSASGAHTATAKIEDDLMAGNYTLTNASVTYTITEPEPEPDGEQGEQDAV